MAPPTYASVHRTMESALASGLEGIHKLPDGIVLADRDRRGRWGESGAYYTYCMRCGAWLRVSDALSHTNCEGHWWDAGLAKAASSWGPELEKMATRVNDGKDPYFGLHDLRSSSPSAVGAIPVLLADRRQLVSMASVLLEEPLDMVIDVPDLPSDPEECSNPLRVIVYLHGHGEDYRHGPRCLPGLAVISAKCPRSVNGQRCFWFQEGNGGAWERHQYEKLATCEAMLQIMANVVDSACAALQELGWPGGVDAEVGLLGVSMGGYGALELARRIPDRVGALAAIAGYYKESEMGALAEDTCEIPMLLVHRKSDRCCPFSNIKKFSEERKEAAKNRAETACWFEEGTRHGPTAEEMTDTIAWLRAALGNKSCMALCEG